MKNKKWLLLLILAFPSAFWLFLESSTINSRRLPYFGPKQVLAAGDTIYHSVAVPADTLPPVFAICFVTEEYRGEAYRLTGVWEYLNYKKDKIAQLPLVMLMEQDSSGHIAGPELQKLSIHRNVSLLPLAKRTFRTLRSQYFDQKPYYIDYSFFALVDEDRHIRGYYDARYVAEIKRLIEEYQHLRLKEAKKKLIESNEIEHKP